MAGDDFGSASADLDAPGYDGENNLVGTDPLLAPLGNYGGPTLTMMPLPGSPAIQSDGGAGGSSFAEDQRRLPRVNGGQVDLGAVEYQGNPDLFVIWDSDSDGSPFGIEIAFGMNPGQPDRGGVNDLRIGASGELVFGVSRCLPRQCLWSCSCR